MNKKVIILLGIMLLIGGVIIGCGDTPEENPNDLDQSQAEKDDEASQEEDESNVSDTDKTTVEESEAEEEEILVDPASVQANELGQVMVLMYHHIDEPEDTWVRTPDNFRRDLQELYDRGYRPVSLADYAKGNIEVEPGYKPVVFT